MFDLSLKNAGEYIDKQVYVITAERYVDKAGRLRSKQSKTIYPGRIIGITIEKEDIRNPYLKAIASVILDEEDFSIVIDNLILNVECFEKEEEAEKAKEMLSTQSSITVTDFNALVKREMVCLFEASDIVEATLYLSKEEAAKLNDMLSITCREIKEKYGYTVGDEIKYTVHMGGNYEMVLQFVITDIDDIMYGCFNIFEAGCEGCGSCFADKLPNEISVYQNEILFKVFIEVK